MADYVLYHHGVKGMKWGIRRYQRKDGSRTSLGERHQLKLNRSYDDGPSSVKRKSSASNPKADIKKTKSNSGDSKKNELTDEQRAERRKKAIKVGAAVVGTALAAYGTYKVAQYMQDKRSQAAMQKAQDYIKNNIFEANSQFKFADGTVRFDYTNKAGDQIVMKGARNQVGKAIGKQNAKTVATARQMYTDATNTKLDKSLAKIVNTGDAVGNTAKRAATSAGNAAKNTATKAKNRVLDVVNPIYEYKPGATTTTTKTINGLNLTETITKYDKIRKKRS